MKQKLQRVAYILGVVLWASLILLTVLEIVGDPFGGPALFIFPVGLRSIQHSMTSKGFREFVLDNLIPLDGVFARAPKGVEYHKGAEDVLDWDEPQQVYTLPQWWYLKEEEDRGLHYTTFILKVKDHHNYPWLPLPYIASAVDDHIFKGKGVTWSITKNGARLRSAEDFAIAVMYGMVDHVESIKGPDDTTREVRKRIGEIEARHEEDKNSDAVKDLLKDLGISPN